MRKLSLILALALLPALAGEQPQSERRELWIYTDVSADGEAQVYASESPHVFESQDLRIPGQKQHMSFRRKARHEVMLENGSGRYRYAIWRVADVEPQLAVALHGLRLELQAVFEGAGDELVVENLPQPVTRTGDVFYGDSPVYAVEGRERTTTRFVIEEQEWALHGWSEQLSNHLGLGAGQADSSAEVTLRGWSFEGERVFVFHELLARAERGPLARDGGEKEDALVWVKEQRIPSGADPDGFGAASPSRGGLLARPARSSGSTAAGSTRGAGSTPGAGSTGAKGSSRGAAESTQAAADSGSSSSSSRSTARSRSSEAANPSLTPGTPVVAGDLAFSTPTGAPLTPPGGSSLGAGAVGAPGSTAGGGLVGGVASQSELPSVGLGPDAPGGSGRPSVQAPDRERAPTVGIVGALGR